MAVPPAISNNMDLFLCPACSGGLAVLDDFLQCMDCGARFPCVNGIPHLYWSQGGIASNSEITEKVRAFYEEYPFPDYDDTDSLWRLRDKAHKGVFARMLDEQIPRTARVLDVGCGTGQLSNFLGTTWGRTVFGADLSLSSLELGNEFRERHRLLGVGFLQMNLFRPTFKSSVFDVVLCTGVLHHTHNPHSGFNSIADLVTPGGYIVIGLYNRLGRIPARVRKFLFSRNRTLLGLLDPRIRDKDIDEERQEIWFMDQYRHPHETTHSIGEVLSWFERSDFVFVNSIPKASFLGQFSKEDYLFSSNISGTKLDHTLVQAKMMLSGGKEGGFFLMIGRRRP